MSKYTQGPWESWIAGSSFGVTGPAAADAFTMRLASVKDKSERSKCIIDIASACGVQPGIALGDNQEEAEANARLIAAAPSMYEYIASSASNGCAEAAKIMEAIHAGR